MVDGTSLIRENHKLKLAYAEFIQSFPWDLYTTITFRKPRVDSIYWSDKIFQVLQKFDCSRSFIACEPHKYLGIHFHVLSRHLPYLERYGSSNDSPIWKYCFKAFGISTVEKVEDTYAVSRYCAKYVVKENSFEFKGDPSAWKLDK